MCRFLSPTVCTLRCSKAEKIMIPLVSQFILTVHFILENWLLFWYNCGLHEKKKKNHLLRNLFFYASAVNVHIVAVWCSMIKKQSGLLWWMSNFSEDHSGMNWGFQKYYINTSQISLEEATQTWLVPTKSGNAELRIGKGILLSINIVATSTGLLINIRQSTRLTSSKGKIPLYS